MADPAGTGGQLKPGRPGMRFYVVAALGVVLCGTITTVWTMGSKPSASSSKPPLIAPEPAPKLTRAQAAANAAVEPDAVLIKTLLAIKANQLDVALAEVEKVLRAYPNFRLANLIKGDLLAARGRPLSAMGSAAGVAPERVADLQDEARARLARYQHERPSDRVPRYLVQLRNDQQYALVVDASKSTLYVFENHKGTARYLADYYISSGKNGYDKLREGDKKTPLGVYYVTSSMPREKLADLYGTGAFPINYPNEWDRREGRKGSGIWLHGTPSDTFSRPPLASDGCVVLTNRDLEAIRQRVQVGLTPVIISSGIEWVRPQAIASVREELNGALEAWRRDWESLKTDRYLGHYSPTFTSGAQNYKAFAEHKRQVNSGKGWIKIKVDRISMFLYPGKEKLAVVTFDQDYTSSNLTNKMRKRQYWLKEGSSWRIIYEGAA